jgi:acyl dehydratase
MKPIWPFFEDLTVSTVETFGGYEVTREEIVTFAAHYDPQPFHLSDEGAVDTPFRSLAASGWHSCGMMMRILVDHLQSDPERQAANIGAVGIDELRWLKPVRSGDRLSCHAEIIEKRVSQSRPDMGLVRSRMTVLNQKGEAVMTMLPLVMVRTRTGC